MGPKDDRRRLDDVRRVEDRTEPAERGRMIEETIDEGRRLAEDIEVSHMYALVETKEDSEARPFASCRDTESYGSVSRKFNDFLGGAWSEDGDSDTDASLEPFEMLPSGSFLFRDRKPADILLVPPRCVDERTGGRFSFDGMSGATTTDTRVGFILEEGFCQVEVTAVVSEPE